MYCPNCAAQIEETQKYCRSCGTEVSLVSQALKGQLPSRADGIDREHRGRLRERRRKDKPPSIEGAVSAFFRGLGFIFVSFAVRAYAPSGNIWWFWLLIPAFIFMGTGIGAYLKLREQHRQQQEAQFDPTPKFSQPALTSPTTRMPESSAPTASDPLSRSSITEDTTRQLDPARKD